MNQKFEYFGKFILLEKLATGGMAEVFLGRAPSAGGMGKFVAIKRILPQFADSPEFIEMFKEEAKIAINISHSNIVSIHEFGIEKDQFFIVMDYVEGRNVRQVLNKMKKTGAKFSIDQIIYVIREMTAGLDHAHRCLDGSTGKPLNITHRDISPQNAMISFEGEIKLVDFGIAKAESQIENTRAGTVKGKFGYMSPEQAEGQVVDLRTDIFSLGIVLWELLANDRLFIANNELNTLRKIRDCQIPSLRKMNPNIHPELERIAQKALARDRNLRYQTAAALHRDLNRFMNRQYPDFSPHDFSVFVKTLFADEILDNRKRLIEYAKVPFKNNQHNFSNSPSPKSQISIDLSEGTDSFVSHNTESKPEEESNVSPSLSIATLEQPKSEQEPKEAKPGSFQLDESALKKDLIGQPHTAEPVKGTQTGSQQRPLAVESTPQVQRPTTQTRHAPRGQAQPTKKSWGWLRDIAILMALVVGAYLYLAKNFPEHMNGVIAAVDPLLSPIHKILNITQSRTATSTLPLPTKAMPPQPTPPPSEPPLNQTEIVPLQQGSVLVRTSPSGAEIHLNGQNTNILTPGRVNLPTKFPFEIVLKRNGYTDYKMAVKDYNQLGTILDVKLAPMEVGYVIVDISPLQAQGLTLRINGQDIIDPRLPTTRISVPAGTMTKIQAFNATKQLYAESTVIVPVGQTKSVQLQLRSRTPSSK